MINALKPFRIKSFRYLMSAQFFNHMSIWMVALLFSLLAEQIKGNSSFYVSMIGFAFNLPFLIFSPFGGVITDRLNRKTFMLIFLAAEIIPIVGLIITVILAPHSYWLVFLTCFLIGAIFTTAFPCWNAIIADLIKEPEVRSRGVSIFTASIRILQFLGYGLGGFVFVYLGSVKMSLLCIVLVVIAFICLARMPFKTKPVQKQINETPTKPLADLIEGFKYTKNHFPILMATLLAFMTGIFVWPYIFILPVINTYHLGGNATTLGIILSLGGIGGSLGGVFMSVRKSAVHCTHWQIVSTFIMGAGLVALALTHSVFYAAIWAAVIDAALTVQKTINLVFIQQVVAENVRGRVLSLYFMASFGTIPFGCALVYGGFGELIGSMQIIFVAGVITIATAALFIFYRGRIRRESIGHFIETGLIADQSEITKI